MLDRDGPIPIYQQIAQVIHDRVLRGELAPGEPVPSELQLELTYGIARTTARRVARELRERGLVHTVRGEGTFVGPLGVPRAPRTTPRYQKIAEEIALGIRCGRYRPNRAIPGEKHLMQRYGVAKATVRQAIAWLRDQGWVFTVPYRGTYVSPQDRWP